MIRRPRQDFLRILSTFFLFKLLQASNLYPFGEEHGDNRILFDRWDVGSREIILLRNISFLGKGSLGKIWVRSRFHYLT